MSWRQYMANHVLGLLPETRLYRAKSAILRFAKADVHESARIVSSVKIWGVCSVHIGVDTFIGHDVLIAGGESVIRIGDHVDIGPRVCIVSGTHQPDPRGMRVAASDHSRDITIGDGTWIGAGALVLGGAMIGKKCVIGAGSVVLNSIPDLMMAVGAPCRCVKHWDANEARWVKM
jgi:acetyltransferase-like isoleucine patch superfamily enzyme